MFKQFATILLSIGISQSFGQVSTHLVISQVYGGGGNAGAQYTNDYIELFNPTASSVNLTGWSLQYAASTSSSWTSVAALTGTIAPYSYYLVQAGSGGSAGVILPAPDATGLLNLSATNGKVAICNASAVLTGTCPSGINIIDFVGYGTSANCYEGLGAAPLLSNSSAIFRKDDGCTDSDNNAMDFSANVPLPRNSSGAIHSCSTIGTDDMADIYLNGIHAYPNPCEGELKVVNNGRLTDEGNVTMEVLNGLGERVYCCAFKTNIDISDFDKGLYLIRISDGMHIYQSKIIKY